jgi:biopolymer transport protein ExbD
MSRVSSIRRHKPDAPELNITAFLNLMVILVPFLLITAVFSQMTILELNLPPKQNDQQDQNKKKERNFEVILRHDRVILADTIGGQIKAFPKVGNQYDMAGLSKLLVRVKEKYPKKQNITILLEPEIPYEALVQVMDTVRIVSVVDEAVEKSETAAPSAKAELFPQISIGDAPPEAVQIKRKGG